MWHERATSQEDKGESVRLDSNSEQSQRSNRAGKNRHTSQCTVRRDTGRCSANGRRTGRDDARGGREGCKAIRWRLNRRCRRHDRHGGCRGRRRRRA